MGILVRRVGRQKSLALRRLGFKDVWILTQLPSQAVTLDRLLTHLAVKSPLHLQNGILSSINGRH